jgi:uncharacterized damage-inducible protein DinB
MTIAESLLPEFDQEMAGTRRVLERVPLDDPEWAPHEKSMKIGYMAGHLADLPHWVTATLENDSLDLHPPGGEPYRSPDGLSRDEVLQRFDANVAKAREALAAAPDEAFHESWTLLRGGQELFSMPKVAVLRSFVMNHMVHHRAQMTVYLRLHDVPVPGLYGPSADEPF